MRQILSCGKLDVSKLDDQAIILNDNAWLGAEVEEDIYLFKSDPNNPELPFVTFTVIKFSSPCTATSCNNLLSRQIEWALSLQENLYENQNVNLEFVSDLTEQHNNLINKRLQEFGSPLWNNSYTNIFGTVPITQADPNLFELPKEGIDQYSLNNLGFQPMAMIPVAAVIPVKSNIEPYGPWVSSNFWESSGGTEVISDPDLSPWTFGSKQMLNNIGLTLVEYNKRGLSKSETGSITIPGIPSDDYNLPKLVGEKLYDTGPNLTSINFSFGSKGVTTTYEFKTYTPKFGKLSKLFIDRYKNLHKQRIKQLKLLRDITSKQNKLYRKIIARQTREKLDTVKADSRSNTMQRVIVGTMQDWYDLGDGVFSQKATVGITTLSKTSLELEKQDPSKAYMSLDGIFSPACIVPDSLPGDYSNLPQSNRPEQPDFPFSVHPDPPNIINPPLKINATYYNPFSDSGDHYHDGVWMGHSIDIVNKAFVNQHEQMQEGIIGSFHSPADYNKKYGTNYNFIALRGPLMLHSWGYDTDGKPIPASQDNKDQFTNNWLQKPKTWPVAPIDLRFDRNRGVWVSPPPHRIVQVQVLEDTGAGGYGFAKIIESSDSPTIAFLSSENRYQGEIAYAYFDTKQNINILLNQDPGLSILTGIVADDLFPETVSVDITITKGPNFMIGRRITVNNYMLCGALKGDTATVHAGIIIQTGPSPSDFYGCSNLNR